MGLIKGSRDWNGNGEYDFFDRAIDYKNFELMQEKSKKIDAYKKRLEYENRKPTYIPTDNSSEESLFIKIIAWFFAILLNPVTILGIIYGILTALGCK